MTLPISRNTTYTPLAQVKSVDLNAIQDFLIDLHLNLVGLEPVNVKAFNAGFSGNDPMFMLAGKSELSPVTDYPMVGVTANVLYASVDGHYWKPDASTNIVAFAPQAGKPKAIRHIYYLDLWVLVSSSAGGEILTAPVGIDAGSWTTRNDPAVDFDRTCISDNGAIIVVSRAGGGFITSPDGITWTERVHPAVSKDMRGVAHGANVFVGVGTDVVVTSPDGITWTDRTANIPGPLAGLVFKDVCYDPTFGFLAIVDTGETMTSPDGITWTQRTTVGPTSAASPVSVISNGAGAVYGIGNVDMLGATANPTTIASLFRTVDGGVTWQFWPVEMLAEVAGLAIAAGRLTLWGTTQYDPPVGFGLAIGPRLIASI